MTTGTAPPAGASPFELEARADLHGAEGLGDLTDCDGIRFTARRGRRNLWIVAHASGRDVAALRLGHGSDELGNVTRGDLPDGAVFEFTSLLGAFRVKVAFPAETGPIRCTTSLLPARDTTLPYWPRDLYALAPNGTVHTNERGLRSGIVFASAQSPVPCALFYFQDFSSLTGYFEMTNRSPSSCVGGRWPELGYAPPAGEGCVLPEAREVVVSDAYLSVSHAAPVDDGEIAAAYLDLLAATYLRLPLPASAYHDWPARARQTLRDLSLSPDCTYMRQGKRYLMPYVADGTKPPESMVQLTVAVNLLEYDGWRGEESRLASTLRDAASSFFDHEAGTLARWLPGEGFDASQAESNMNHEDMDSWYLHHELFNLSRLANAGDASARALFERSLPFAMRAARRFNYRWPIFFNLRTLDVVRAESAPGKGGETDVGGFYALIMLHAFEMFGKPEYLDEAKLGVHSLRGLGFTLGYQLNTTGFAAEAALRLWKLTREREYLALSEICIANLFDNMWLWQCDYARARHYRPFFGLFPLRDAPYLAAYEELEAQAKAHDYLELGGEDIRPSLRLLLAEYQKYSLDRAWFYYPDALPETVIAAKSRNGRIERALSVPLEDLQDGYEESGQVGQEVYGAGMPFVYTTRHYKRVAGKDCYVYCNYPAYDFTLEAAGGETRARWRMGGDPRCSCELRVIPIEPNAGAAAVAVTTTAGEVRVPLRGKLTTEGHAAFVVRGGRTVEILWKVPERAGPHDIIIGAGSTR